MPVSGRLFYRYLGINSNSDISLDRDVNVVRVEVNGEATELAIPLSGRLVTHLVNAGDSITFWTMPNIHIKSINSATVILLIEIDI